MSDKIPFFSFFESFAPSLPMRLLLREAYIVSGSLDRARRSMELTVEVAEPLSESMEAELRRMLLEQYHLQELRLTLRTVRRADAPVSGTAGGEQKGKVLLGKESKIKRKDMDTLRGDSGRVSVEGRVFPPKCMRHAARACGACISR